VSRPVLQQGAHRGGPDDRADLPGGVQQAGCRPGHPRVHLAHGDRGQRRERAAHAEAGHDQRRQEILPGRGRRRDQHRPAHPDGEQAELAEALFCPFCDDSSPMYRHRALSRGRPYFYYRCFGRGSERQSCGNSVRVELVDAAVNEIMAMTFDIPVMRYEIVYGNEAEIEAELERLKFELSQLGKLGLNDEEEDTERAPLRAERDRVASAEVVEDRAELIETADTYLELWDRLGVPERGPWLAKHDFRVTASKERVTVSQGSVSASVPLSEPERMAPVRDTTPLYRGECACGCGTDIYSSKYGQPRKFVNRAHAQAAYRRRMAAREDSE
jgi:hypothetical protein